MMTSRGVYTVLRHLTLTFDLDNDFIKFEFCCLELKQRAGSVMHQEFRIHGLIKSAFVFRTGITNTKLPWRHIFIPTSQTRCQPSGSRITSGPARRTLCGRCGSSITCISNRCMRFTAIFTSTRAVMTIASVSIDESRDYTTPGKDARI